MYISNWICFNCLQTDQDRWTRRAIYLSQAFKRFIINIWHLVSCNLTLGREYPNPNPNPVLCSTQTFRTVRDVQEDAVIGRKRDFARTRNAVVTSPERDQPEFTIYDFAVPTSVIPTSTRSAEHGKNYVYDYASPTRTYHTVREFLEHHVQPSTRMQQWFVILLQYYAKFSYTVKSEWTDCNYFVFCSASLLYIKCTGVVRSFWLQTVLRWLPGSVLTHHE